MDDAVRVTVETDEGARSARLNDDEDAVTVDDVTFRFDVSDARRPTGQQRDDGDEGASPIEEADVGDDGDRGTEDDGDSAPSDPAEDPLYVTTLEDVPANTTLRFEALAGRRGVEGILQRQGDSVVAWENACAHEPDVRIDKGMGAFVADGQLVCENHGARFDCDDGFCTHGPCRGQSLNPIDVEVRDGCVYVTDDRFDAGRKLGL